MTKEVLERAGAVWRRTKRVEERGAYRVGDVKEEGLESERFQNKKARGRVNWIPSPSNRSVTARYCLIRR